MRRRNEKLSVSGLAQDDLLEIYTFVAENNEPAGVRLMRTFRQKFERLAQFPEMGKERNELVIGWRSFPVGKYIVLYQVTGDVLEIVRVHHGSTDIDNLFEDF